MDFAYRIHSDIGHKCVGAKINGKIVPVSYRLKNGDIVEILTSPNSKGPSRDWIKIVQSSNARNKIKNWFKKADREENIVKGKEMLEAEIKRLGYQYEKFNQTKFWDYVLERYGYPNLTEMHSAIGYGGIKAGQILRKIISDFPEDFPQKEKTIKSTIGKGKNAAEKAIKIGGFSNMAVRIAKCCNPVPGDEAIGFITRGRGVTVHRMDCANVLNMQDEERLIQVEWQQTENATFLAKILVETMDDAGALSDLARIFSDEKIYVQSLNAKSIEHNVALYDVVLEVKSKKELNEIISKIRI